MNYETWASGHRKADVFTLSRQPREQQYEPRPCDVVEFEETVEAVVLESEATPQQASA